MTTPLYQNTPIQVIGTAMQNAGLLGQGDMPNSEEIAQYMVKLNNMCSLLQTQGIKLWLQLDVSIAPIQGQSLYGIGPGQEVNMTKPTRAIEAYFLDQNAVQRPVTLISRQEWDTLSTKTTQGQLNSIYVNKQASVLYCNFWLTPDANTALGTAHVIVQQQQAYVTSLVETMVFPVEWFLALSWGLAYEICTGQPQAVINRCQMQWVAMRELLDSWDVEDVPTTFSPDQRMVMQGRRFN